MKKPTDDNILILPPEEALLDYFQNSNRLFLRIMVAFFIVIFVPISIFLFISASFWEGLPGLLISICFALLWVEVKKNNTWHRHFRLSAYFLFLLLIIWLSEEPAIWEEQTAFRMVVFFTFPVLLFFFRFRFREYVYIACTLVFLLEFDSFVPYHDPSIKRGIVGAILLLVIFVPVYFFTRIKKRSFLKRWHIEYNRNKDRLRMKLELEQAREVQMSILPNHAPEGTRLDISGKSLPAAEVGGDFYDFIQVSEHQTGLVVGDVSGHGLASGLVLHGVRSGLYLLEDHWHHPSEILLKLNRMIKKTTDKKTFMTFLYGIFDFKEYTLRLSNAGHPPVLHYSQEEKKIISLRFPALPLGGALDTTYKEINISFAPGDIFLFYSDGLTESWNAEEEQYEEKGLIKTFESLLTLESAQEIRDALLDDVRTFSGEVDQEDDITLIVVRAK